MSSHEAVPLQSENKINKILSCVLLVYTMFFYQNLSKAKIKKEDQEKILRYSNIFVFYGFLPTADGRKLTIVSA